MPKPSGSNLALSFWTHKSLKSWHSYTGKKVDCTMWGTWMVFKKKYGHGNNCYNLISLSLHHSKIKTWFKVLFTGFTCTLACYACWLLFQLRGHWCRVFPGVTLSWFLLSSLLGYSSSVPVSYLCCQQNRIVSWFSR